MVTLEASRIVNAATSFGRGRVDVTSCTTTDVVICVKKTSSYVIIVNTLYVSVKPTDTNRLLKWRMSINVFKILTNMFRHVRSQLSIETFMQLKLQLHKEFKL